MSAKKIEPVTAPILIGKMGLTPHDEAFSKAYPTLSQLIMPRYDSAQRCTREAGVISIRVSGSLFRVTVVCPTEGVQAVLMVTTLCDLFERVELHVSSPEATWEPTWDRMKRSKRSLDKALDSSYDDA